LLVSRHPSRIPSELVSGIRLTPAETLVAAARDLGVLDLVLMGLCAAARPLHDRPTRRHSGTFRPSFAEL
jgi:hypothetical protein